MVFTSHDSAQQRRKVHQASVAAVDFGGVGLVEHQRLHHEQHEDGAHAVVAEAFPHFGHEQQVQTARVLSVHEGLSLVMSEVHSPVFIGADFGKASDCADALALMQ